MTLSPRAGALLAAGSMAVHELRYLAGYGDGGAAAAAGHGYLAWLAPLTALALAAACGAWLGRAGRRDRAAPALTWRAASASLGGVYVVQETIEALTVPGHSGLVAHGGWVAIPIVLAVAGLVALLVRGSRAADRAATAAVHPWSPVRTAPAAPFCFALPAAAPLAPRPRGLARRVAGRAPPVAS